MTQRWLQSSQVEDKKRCSIYIFVEKRLHLTGNFVHFSEVIFLNPKHGYLLLFSCSFTQGKERIIFLINLDLVHTIFASTTLVSKISLYYVRWQLHIGNISWEMRWILTYQFNYLTFSESKSLNYPLEFFDKNIYVPNLSFWYMRKC